MITKAQKRWMLYIMAIFVSTATLAVVVNSLSHGWHLNYSISRYVGLETWSSVVFALGNVMVAGLFGKYLYAVGEAWRMPKWFYTLVVLMAVALIWLSACPVGYFDALGAEFASSTPSRVHQLSSRTMFACMLVMALVWLLGSKVQTGVRYACAGFVAYGLICFLAFFGEWEWFRQGTLVFESTYLLGFMLLCWGLQGKAQLTKG